MRVLVALAACMLAGCNWVFGLDAPAGDRDATATDGDGPSGDGPDAAPVPVQGMTIAAGGSHTCVVRSDGVRCWGRGDKGQLGYGNGASVSQPALVGAVPLGLVVVVQIVAGESHTCALLDSGALRCWGDGAKGRLGYGAETDLGDDELPTAVGTVQVGAIATQIAAGGAHTCAVVQQHAYCWGDATQGKLGYGNTLDLGDDELPVAAGAVPTPGLVYAVAAGLGHTCALLTDGRVQCWGLGVDGRLGYGETANRGDQPNPPQATLGLGAGAIVQLVTGNAHSCVLIGGGAVKCWGDGGNGALGYSSTQDLGDDEAIDTLPAVAIGGNARAITAGGNHTCALLDTGAVRCWGHASSGQLGYGNVENIGDNETPAVAGDVALGGAAIAITAGAAHTCAVLADGAVRCWGSNGVGQLGLGAVGNLGDNERPDSVGPIDF